MCYAMLIKFGLSLSCWIRNNSEDSGEYVCQVMMWQHMEKVLVIYKQFFDNVIKVNVAIAFFLLPLDVFII